MANNSEHNINHVLAIRKTVFELSSCKSSLISKHKTKTII